MLLKVPIFCAGGTGDNSFSKADRQSAGCSMQRLQGKNELQMFDTDMSGCLAWVRVCRCRVFGRS